MVDGTNDCPFPEGDPLLLIGTEGVKEFPLFDVCVDEDYVVAEDFWQTPFSYANPSLQAQPVLC